jgi:putative ABC transport system permease protein
MVMMMSALLKKSFSDLKRRKARTVFTILTIALAVSALGLFAVMPLMSQAMESEIEESNLYDVSLRMNDMELNDTHIQRLSEIENVRSVETKSLFITRMYIGQRRDEALLVGVEDFSEQDVDKVIRDSGRDPKHLEVLTDVGNSRSDLYNGEFGDSARIYDSNGQVRQLEITGTGHCLPYTDLPTWGTVVFYVNMDTVHTLANTSGVNAISLDLEDTDADAAQRTIADVEDYLERNTGFVAFAELPEIREEGDYPFKSTFEDIMSFFYVLAFMTLFCSLFLISNTMHTIIIEQKKEIAQLKAIGATKLQVLRSYITTNFIMGLTASLIGAALGILIAYLIGMFLFSSFFGLSLGFGIHPTVVLISIVVGVSITVIAALPALLMSLRTTTREGMENSGITSNYNRSMFNRLMMKMGFIPRSAQMSLRNVSRKKGRSISTIIQVALAVGMFLGLVAIGYTVPAGIEGIFDDYGSDIVTYGHMTGANPLTEDLQFVITGIEGVDRAEPFLDTQGFLEGIEFDVEGYQHNTFMLRYEDTLQKGRWFSEEDSMTCANVIILNRFLARDAGKEIGDIIDVQLATGVHSFEVIGLDEGFGDWGRAAYMPFTSLQELLLLDDVVTGFGIKTTTGEHDLIDRISTQIEDLMLSKGYVVNNYIPYVDLEQSKAFNQNIISVMIAVGTLIVFITLIGLMSTLTMNVIERTKEIGMLRCIGSSSRSIRSVFGLEGLALAFVGWIIGIPLGYAVARFLNYMTLTLMDCDFALVFPVHIVFIGGLVTLALTLIVIQPPLWRATHFKPGEALRFE